MNLEALIERTNELAFELDLFEFWDSAPIYDPDDFRLITEEELWD